MGRPVLRRCGWGVAVLHFTDVFAPSLVVGRGGGPLGSAGEGGRTPWSSAVIFGT